MTEPLAALVRHLKPYNSLELPCPATRPIDRDLSSTDEPKKLAAAGEVYRLGRAAAGICHCRWWAESELSRYLLAPNPVITVESRFRGHFHRIELLNGTPRLADVPPRPRREEFDPDLQEGISLDILSHARAGRLRRHCEIPG